MNRVSCICRWILCAEPPRQPLLWLLIIFLNRRKYESWGERTNVSVLPCTFNTLYNLRSEENIQQVLRQMNSSISQLFAVVRSIIKAPEVNLQGTVSILLKSSKLRFFSLERDDIFQQFKIFSKMLQILRKSHLKLEVF